MLSLDPLAAQSKRELKEQAKRQELVNMTTDQNDGSRWFLMNKTLRHIRVKVRDCYLSNGDVVVKILVYNNDNRDDTLMFLGDFYSSGRDDEGLYIKGDKISYSIGSRDRFEHTLNDVFIPANGLLKMKIKIEGANPNIVSLRELRFGLKTALSGEYTTFMNNCIYDLNVRK